MGGRIPAVGVAGDGDGCGPAAVEVIDHRVGHDERHGAGRLQKAVGSGLALAFRKRVDALQKLGELVTLLIAHRISGERFNGIAAPRPGGCTGERREQSRDDEEQG